MLESSEDEDLAALLEEAEEEDGGEDDEEEDMEDDAEEDAEEELEAALAGPAVAAEKALEGGAGKEEASEVQKEMEDAAPDAGGDSELEKDAAGDMDAELIADLEVAAPDGQEEEDGGEAEDEDDADDLGEEAEEEEDNADGAKDMADDADDPGQDGGDDAAMGVPKRRGKPIDPHAPKKPLLPWTQFCSEARPKLVEEKPELRGDLKGMTTALAAGFAELPAEKKEAMQRAYEKDKAKYDELMAEYKKTDTYKAFQRDFMAWRDAKDVKKLQKKQKALAPKKPMSGYWAFGAVAREEIKRDSPGLSMGEMGKKVAERWAALSAEERQRHNKDSCAARERWEQEMKTYRHSEKYHIAVDEMADLEIKQGMRRLKTEFDGRIPKRPPNPVLIYSTETNVTGSLAQRSERFKALPQEEQRRYSEEGDKLGQKFKADMAAFLASKDGNIYTRRAASIKHKATLRAARSKYLVDAPKRPPNAKAVFIQKKREELEASNDRGDTGTVLAARAAGLWDAMDEAARRPFEEEAARLAGQFEKAMDDFKESDAYKKLKAAESKASGGKRTRGASIKGRAKGKGKAKAKAKSKARAKAASLVARPESMPAKPPDAYRLYCKELQSAGKTGSRASFAALSNDEAQRLHNEVLKLKKQYAEDLAKFMKTKDGKMYQRKLDAAGHKQKVARAKAKLKESEPTKPPSAFGLFRASCKGSGGGLPSNLWTKLTEEGRKHWELEHEKQMEEYKKAMEVFRKSASYKKFERATKARGKAGAKGPGKPASMPKKPPNPFFFFLKDMAGKGMDRNAHNKAWADLGTEGQQKYRDQAQSAMARYKEDMAIWSGTADGKKLMRAENQAQKKRTDERLKQKHLKAPDAPEPPTKPKSAKMIFLEERRTQILKEEGPKANAPRELAARLVKEWEGLSATARKVWEDKERSYLDVYEFEMEEYQSSEAYQKYCKAAASKGVGKGKARKGRGAKRKSGELSFDSDDDEMGSDSSSSDAGGISD